MRFDAAGNKIEDFILHREPFDKAGILVSSDNFGCGSSREHAPWALLDFGIRSIIATSFADIFYNNCFKNGILPIQLPQEQVDKLMEAAANEQEITVDLESQTVSAAGFSPISFEVDPFRKHCLINGLDDISLTEQKADKIDSFEVQNKTRCPLVACCLRLGYWFLVVGSW